VRERTVIQKLFKFSELTKAAQTRVIDTERERVNAFIVDDINSLFDDGAILSEDANAIGLTFAQRPAGRNRYTGKPITVPAVFWELHTQSQGVSIEGTWERPTDPVGAMIAHTGATDGPMVQLPKIAAELATVPPGTSAKITSDRDRAMHFEVFTAEGDEAKQDTAATVIAALRAFAHYLHKMIEAEDEHLTSDEKIREDLEEKDAEYYDTGEEAEQDPK
jgi:hypothetical protein